MQSKGENPQFFGMLVTSLSHFIMAIWGLYYIVFKIYPNVRTVSPE